MDYKNNAMFIAARNGRQASPVTVSVLRPRVSPGDATGARPYHA